MKGSEHYVQAEMLLDLAGYRDAASVEPGAPNAATRGFVDAAQVHATLALAAAAAANIRRNGAVNTDGTEWAEVFA